MRLPSAVVAAANTYFAFKNKTRTGVFENGAVKETCLKAIDRACVKHGIGFCAAPGLLMFSKGKQKCDVTEPILPKVK